MSLGATTSAPASTWLTAVRTSSSSDSSFTTSPSRTTPQWPCDVYSQRQTSVSRTSSGNRSRRSSVAHDAAVAVRRVLAEADVGEQDELREPVPQVAEGELDDPVVLPGAGGLLVLRLRDPE